MIQIEIDHLTNSIVNATTGDVFDTEVLPVTAKDLKKLSKWQFKWAKEKPFSEIYKLVIVGNRDVIQGLVALRDEKTHLYMALIESAPFNIGKLKMYVGVPGNLVAFACKTSFDKGYNGYVAFHAKSVLVEHYEQTLGAYRPSRGLLMVIETKAAEKLVTRYFKS